MKNVKNFEDYNKVDGLPNIGDYVVFKLARYDADINNFTSNNLGKVIDISKNIYTDSYFITVGYDNIDSIPKIKKYEFKYDNGLYIMHCSSNTIEYFSKNKEDVEIYINSKKYNL